MSAYKFCNDKAPAYASDIYKRVDYSNATRSGKHKLKQPFRSFNVGQRGLSYLGPKLWNNISSNIKSAESSNAFKHQIKDHFFKVLQEKEDNIYVYYWWYNLIFVTNTTKHMVLLIILYLPNNSIGEHYGNKDTGPTFVPCRIICRVV